MLFTIGHSNYTIERLVQMLEEYSIDTVIDVRSRPYSKYSPHFNRPQLRDALHHEKLGYKWGGRILGGMAKATTKDEEFTEQMEKVVQLSEDGQNIALMCSERSPQDCHRAYKLTSWLLRHGHSVTHIVPDGFLNGQALQDEMVELDPDKDGWVEE